MKGIPESISKDELLEKAFLRICQAVYRVDVGLTLTEMESLAAEDLSCLTVQAILNKIKDFLNSDPIDEHYNIFLHYLAKYPVSMCERQVSPILRFLIGFHYRIGQMYKEESRSYQKVNSVSMQELSEIFGRSKATIHDCIKDTEEEWKEFLDLKKKEEEIEEQAKREPIKDAKKRLREKKVANSQV